MKVVLCWLQLTVAVLGSASWQDIRPNVAEDAFYSEFPQIIFAPSGRLPSLEQVLPLAVNPSDPSATLAIAIQCRDGIVTVTTLPKSPYLYDPKTLNATKQEHSLYMDDTTTSSLSSSSLILSQPPFARLGKRLFGLTAGNAVDSMRLSDMVQDLSEALREEQDAITARAVARRLADRLQIRTQQIDKGRILASTALLIDSEEIWRVDLTGQFHKCRVGIVGRAAKVAERKLLEVLRGDGGTNDVMSAASLQARLDDMTKEQALEVACRTIRDALKVDLSEVRVRLCACFVGDKTFQWYSQRELTDLLLQDEVKSS